MTILLNSFIWWPINAFLLMLYLNWFCDEWPRVSWFNTWMIAVNYFAVGIHGTICALRIVRYCQP